MINESEIKEIIKQRLQDETVRCIRDSELIDRVTEQAVERINGVYTSTIKALETLEFKDTIFDFFQRTQGNIRVFEEELITYEFDRTLDCSIDGRLLFMNVPIRLAPRKRYKIIVMAMELKGETK